MTKHYTAIVEIQEVTHTPERKEYGNVVPASKDSRELTRFVVRYDDLEGLKEKLQKYIELV